MAPLPEITFAKCSQLLNNWQHWVADMLGCSLQLREVHLTDVAVHRDLFSRFSGDHTEICLGYVQRFLEIQVVLKSRQIRPHLSHGTRAENVAIDIGVDSRCVRMCGLIAHILSVVQIAQTHSRCISLAAAVSSSRNAGCARAIKACALSVEDLPLRLAEPNSVTTNCVSVRGVVTGPSNRATIRDTLPLAAVEWQAMIDLPPREA